jgi:GTP cyclohydrolase I
MKRNATSLNTRLIKEIDEEAENHYSASIDTPLRPDAFDLTDEEKVEKIRHHFAEIMHTMGLDLTDDSLKDTPKRVAKMFVYEVFSGLNPANKPPSKLFDNKYQYNEILIERDITLFSYCEHHFVPIVGKAHVGYISTGQVIGLSKLNRIVQYYASRPQVQERMTIQIAKALAEALETDDVALIIEADHLCVAARGVKDTNSTTITAHYSGVFKEPAKKQEFLELINVGTK